MYSTPTAAQGQQLVAYLTPPQAQWLNDTLTQAKIQFRIDRTEKGFVVFTNEAARPYLEKLFPPKKKGAIQVDFRQLGRLLLVLGVPAAILYLLVASGWLALGQGAIAAAGMLGFNLLPLVVFVVGLVGWWAIFFVVGRKPHIIGTLGYLLLLLGATYLASRL